MRWRRRRFQRLRRRARERHEDAIVFTFVGERFTASEFCAQRLERVSSGTYSSSGHLHAAIDLSAMAELVRTLEEQNHETLKEVPAVCCPLAFTEPADQAVEVTGRIVRFCEKHFIELLGHFEEHAPPSGMRLRP
jgi:hypothetical protein